MKQKSFESDHEPRKITKASLAGCRDFGALPSRCGAVQGAARLYGDMILEANIHVRPVRCFFSQPASLADLQLTDCSLTAL